MLLVPVTDDVAIKVPVRCSTCMLTSHFARRACAKMLTEQRKGTVNCLTDEELEIEVSRGRASRFQRELFDYAKAQLTIRKESKQAELSQRQLEVAKQTKTAVHLG